MAAVVKPSQRHTARRNSVPTECLDDRPDRAPAAAVDAQPRATAPPPFGALLSSPARSRGAGRAGLGTRPVCASAGDTAAHCRILDLTGIACPSIPCSDATLGWAAADLRGGDGAPNARRSFFLRQWCAEVVVRSPIAACSIKG